MGYPSISPAQTWQLSWLP